MNDKPVGGKVLLPWNVPKHEWLEARRNYVTGTDAPAMYDAAYKDLFTIWAIKTRRADDDDETIAMRRGLDLEDAMIKHWIANYAEFPLRIWRSGMLVSKRWPIAAATIDRRSKCPTCPDGMWCTVEGKTSVQVVSHLDDGEIDRWSPAADADVPLGPYVQGQWGLGVSGGHHTHFVIMGPRFVPFHKIMYRDDAFIEAAMSMWTDWWQRHVIADVAPEASAKAEPVIRRLYRAAEPTVDRYLDDDGAALMREAAELKEIVSSGERRLNDLKAALKARAADASRLLWPDGTVAATWNESKTTIDGVNADWKRARPDLVNTYGTPRTIWDVNTAQIAADFGDELTERTGLLRRRTFLIKKLPAQPTPSKESVTDDEQPAVDSRAS